MLKKRSISPLIATILLIVVSVILITVVLTWGSGFAKEKLSIAQKSAIKNTDFTGLITNRSLSSKNILVSNNHSSKDLTITGYKIISSIDHYLYDYFENKIYSLEAPLVIGSRQAEVLQIDCYPQDSFFIDLITDQNTYVKTQVLAGSINDIDPLNCGFYGGWLFDEEDGTIVYDYSNYKHNGILINNITRVFADNRKAIDINNISNNSYVNITFPELFSDIKNNDFTISFWFNSRDLNVYSNWIRIVDITKDSTNYVQFVIPANNKIQFLVRDTDTYKRMVINSSTILDLDTWYFVTGVHNSKENSVKIYLNGVDKSSVGSTSAISGTTNSFNIGRRSNNAGYYNGLISDFRIYNRLLTDQEIMNIYELTK